MRLCFVLIEKCHLLADSILRIISHNETIVVVVFFVDFDRGSFIAHMNQVQIHDSELGGSTRLKLKPSFGYPKGPPFYYY